jgi:uncharacterized protein YodC (DUF2158 family)
MTNGNVGVPTMLKLPKPAAIAIQATLGIALSAPWAVPALAAPANRETQSQTTPLLHEGDLVRLRSGGPAMTVKSVQGNWVIATWWSEGYGGFQSSGFPRAMVDGPITLPPVKVSMVDEPITLPPVSVSPQTSPTERSDRPPVDSSSAGQPNQVDLSSTGQPNQNATAQGTNQTRQVRPANAGTSMSPSTRPARISLSQQDTGPLRQGTATNQTIGVPRVRSALILLSQQGTVLNQTVIPLQQGTSTNPTIGVPQVRPVLVLPQGTVQMATPLPLQQGTNAGASMRPQGVFGKRF